MFNDRIHGSEDPNITSTNRWIKIEVTIVIFKPYLPYVIVTYLFRFSMIDMSYVNHVNIFVDHENLSSLPYTVKRLST